jgi:hypothetical protein
MTDKVRIYAIFKRAIGAQLQEEPDNLEDGFMALDMAN